MCVCVCSTLACMFCGWMEAIVFLCCQRVQGIRYVSLGRGKRRRRWPCWADVLNKNPKKSFPQIPLIPKESLTHHSYSAALCCLEFLSFFPPYCLVCVCVLLESMHVEICVYGVIHWFLCVRGCVCPWTRTFRCVLLLSYKLLYW